MLVALAVKGIEKILRGFRAFAPADPRCSGGAELSADDAALPLVRQDCGEFLTERMDLGVELLLPPRAL